MLVEFGADVNGGSLDSLEKHLYKIGRSVRWRDGYDEPSRQEDTGQGENVVSRVCAER
jgi:hypothetical protein